ncbi:MAG: transposase [Halobacteriota archaeon]
MAHLCPRGQTRRRGKVKDAELIPERDVRLCVVGDGARWLWKAIKEIFPDAIQVLDYFHASEHIYKAAEGLNLLIKQFAILA